MTGFKYLSVKLAHHLLYIGAMPEKINFSSIQTSSNNQEKIKSVIELANNRRLKQT